MNEEAQISPSVTSEPPERPTQTAGHAGDSMVRQLGLSVVRRSAPRRVADTSQLQALPEDLADSSATISEGDGNSEEDRAECLTSCDEPATKRQRRVDWQEMSRFQSKEQWQAAFGNEGHFVLHNTRYTTKGALKTFRCTYAKKAGWHHCPNQLRVEFLAGGQVVQSWNGEDHYHQKNLVSQVAPLKDAQVQSAIKEGVLDGLMPERIVMKLERHGLPVPSRRALYNKIAYIRRTLIKDSSKFSTKDLRDWAETLSGSIDEDAALVIGQHIEDSAAEDGVPSFQVTLSTRRLVQLLGKTRHWPLHIDGTYKLTWQGFPVLISGITDVQHRFHPVSLSLVSHEGTNAYLEVFTAQKEALWEESHRQLAPLFVIADGSPAITAASRIAFPECPRAMCWAHVVRNVDKKLLGVSNVDRRNRFRRDLFVLQLATSPAEFKDAWALFKDHYSRAQQLGGIVEYIQQTWIDSDLGNWFEGFQNGFPSTNNGLERANRSLKDDYTLHVKLGLAQFLKKMEEAITHWSKRERREPFQESLTPSLAEWTEAWQWKSMGVPRRRLVSRASREAHLIPAKGHIEDFDDNCRQYLPMMQHGFGTWREYRSYRQCLWMVERKRNRWFLHMPGWN